MVVVAGDWGGSGAVFVCLLLAASTLRRASSQLRFSFVLLLSIVCVCCWVATTFRRATHRFSLGGRDKRLMRMK